MFYPIELTPDDNDTFLATCPLLPEVTTFGETEVEALQQAQNAVEEAIAARMSAFQEIPKPTAEIGVAPGLGLQIKLQLYWALSDKGMSRADLMRALGWQRAAVDRLFDPDHESKTSRMDAAMRAVGQRFSIQSQHL